MTPKNDDVALGNDWKVQKDVTYILFLFGAKQSNSIKCSLHKIVSWSWSYYATH